MKSKPKNVEGLLFYEQEAGYLVGYLSGLYAKDNNVTTIGSVGGQKIPPVDHYIAGFQAGAKKADPSDQDAQRLLPGLRRPGEVQGARAQPDRQGLEGRVPGRGPVRPRRPRRGQGEEHPGHRRRRRPGLPGPAGLHQRAQEGRRRRRQRDQGRPGRQVHRRHGRHQLGQDRRHRLRQARTPRPRSTPIRSSRSRRTSRPARSRTSRIPSSRYGERPRAARDHEALRVDRRERRGRLRPEARRGPRAARGERRRQVDADERPLRALQARRGRDPRRRPARQHRLAAGGHRARDRHGPPALHARPGHDRGREHRAGQRAAQGPAARLRGAPRRACASCRTATASPSTPTRASRTSASACSSAWRSCARCSAARGSSSSTSRPPCSPPRRRATSSASSRR